MPSKDFSAFLYSVIIHTVVLLVLLSISPTVIKPVSPKVIKTISAKLFSSKKVASVTNEQDNKNPKHFNGPKIVKTNDKIIKEVDVKKAVKSLANNKVDINKTSAAETLAVKKQKFSSFSSLKSLQGSISEKSFKESADIAYKEYVESRNFIPKSTTKLNQIPEAKPVTVELNCNSTFNKGMKILSGMLGGSIKCKSYNGSQKFIDARLIKLGKKKDDKE